MYSHLYIIHKRSCFSHTDTTLPTKSSRPVRWRAPIRKNIVCQVYCSTPRRVQTPLTVTSRFCTAQNAAGESFIDRERTYLRDRLHFGPKTEIWRATLKRSRESVGRCRHYSLRAAIWHMKHCPIWRTPPKSISPFA